MDEGPKKGNGEPSAAELGLKRALLIKDFNSRSKVGKALFKSSFDRQIFKLDEEIAEAKRKEKLESDLEKDRKVSKSKNGTPSPAKPVSATRLAESIPRSVPITGSKKSEEKATSVEDSKIVDWEEVIEQNSRQQETTEIEPEPPSPPPAEPPQPTATRRRVIEPPPLDVQETDFGRKLRDARATLAATGARPPEQQAPPTPPAADQLRVREEDLLTPDPEPDPRQAIRDRIAASKPSPKIHIIADKDLTAEEALDARRRREEEQAQAAREHAEQEARERAAAAERARREVQEREDKMKAWAEQAKNMGPKSSFVEEETVPYQRTGNVLLDSFITFKGERYVVKDRPDRNLLGEDNTKGKYILAAMVGGKKVYKIKGEELQQLLDNNQAQILPPSGKERELLQKTKVTLEKAVQILEEGLAALVKGEVARAKELSKESKDLLIKGRVITFLKSDRRKIPSEIIILQGKIGQASGALGRELALREETKAQPSVPHVPRQLEKIPVPDMTGMTLGELNVEFSRLIRKRSDEIDAMEAAFKRDNGDPAEDPTLKNKWEDERWRIITRYYDAITAMSNEIGFRETGLTADERWELMRLQAREKELEEEIAKEEAAEASKKEIIPNSLMEDQISELLRKMEQISKVIFVKLEGEESEMKLSTKFVASGFTIEVNAKLVARAGLIVVEDHEVKAVWPAKGKVEAIIGPKLGEVPKLLEEYIGKEKNKVVKWMDIKDGKLEVTFE